MDVDQERITSGVCVEERVTVVSQGSTGESAQVPGHTFLQERPPVQGHVPVLGSVPAPAGAPATASNRPLSFTPPRCWSQGRRLRVGDADIFFRFLLPPVQRLILIMIHGAGQHSGQFLEFARACAAAGLGVYAIDLRGFGLSSGRRGHVDSFRQYLCDLDGVVAWVHHVHEGLPVYLVGHSLGGTVAIRYAQEYPGRVQGAVLSAPALRIRVRIPRALRHLAGVMARCAPGFGIQPDAWPRLTRWLPDLRHCVPGVGERRDRLCTMEYTARWLVELLRNGAQALDRALDFRVPALFLCGEDDPVVDPLAIRQFFDGLPVPDKRYESFIGVGHRLFHGEKKRHVMERAITWLRERA
ncbi:alpha/beta hydrolase [Alicyclobacillus macrosporangiidus]|uniref:alpha/beta hydrolase n=1 Tax=Alicyclobacillus macrosporangiidus TaxID=392015 RepID=UPI00068B448F|nr:alpha/beta hydrolase [Alicyclobacillus macrosporangiidus]